MSDWILPDWPAPANVRAVSTARTGGASTDPWSSFNLAEHVQDDPDHVVANRYRLTEDLDLPSEPRWLGQEHGTRIITAEQAEHNAPADGSTTRERDTVCVVMTADCLPLLLCDRSGTTVGAVHGGWKGLAAGVIESAIEAMVVDADQLIAWMGPAIGPEAYEVGDEVRAAMLAADPEAGSHFKAAGDGHWLMDIYGLARQRLARSGVTSVHGGGFCTATDAERFFSFRRDGVTGRMASLIWLA